MFCPGCGYELNNGESFCPVCGSAILNTFQDMNENQQTWQEGQQQTWQNGQQTWQDGQQQIWQNGQQQTWQNGQQQMWQNGQQQTWQGQSPYPQLPPPQIPTAEMPTTRVTISGDTDQLKGSGNTIQGIAANATSEKLSRKEKKKFKVKKKRKHVAFKIGLVLMLLAGIGVGAYFGVRALLSEPKARFKAFSKENVRAHSDGSHYVENQLLVRGSKDSTEKKIEKLAEEKSGSIVGVIPITHDYQVEFEKGTTVEELESIIREWQKNSLVASVKLHYAYGSEGGTKYADNPWRDDNNRDNPYGTALEWNLQSPKGNNWAAVSVWAPKVWDAVENGEYFEKAKIGIVDSTIDTDHKDLSGRFVQFPENDSDNGKAEGQSPLVEGNPTDDNGTVTIREEYKAYEGKYGDNTLTAEQKVDEKRLSHGTHMAGIIGANMDDDFGITGVAQNSELYGYACSHETAYKDDAYSKEYALTSVFEYEYALSRMVENDVKVVNFSMQIDPMIANADTKQRLIDLANQDLQYFLQSCIDEGKELLIVKSAGDDSKSDLGNDFLSGIQNADVRKRIIVVGGAQTLYDGSDQLLGYEKTGTTNYGERIDIYAPGPDVLSDIPGDRTEMRSGSSEAAAFVTGACGIVMGILPDATVEEIRDIVLNHHIFTVKVTVNGVEYERGYLNLDKIMKAAQEKKSQPEQPDDDDDDGVKYLPAPSQKKDDDDGLKYLPAPSVPDEWNVPDNWLDFD